MSEPVPAPTSAGPASRSTMPTWAKGAITAVGAVAVGVLSVLTTFNVVHWSAAQATLATAETAAVLAFLTAVIAHFWPGTSHEPVALAATFTALCSATTALGVGFGWWHWRSEQTAAVNALISAIVGVLGALAARHVVVARARPGSGTGTAD